MDRPQLIDFVLRNPLDLSSYDCIAISLRQAPRLKKWEEGWILGNSLCHIYPDEFSGWIHTAYCYHHGGRTEKARDTLLAAPPQFYAEALYNYNLACYQCQLGKIDEAARLLMTCFDLDTGFRKMALDDPDLKKLWAHLS